MSGGCVAVADSNSVAVGGILVLKVSVNSIELSQLAQQPLYNSASQQFTAYYVNDLHTATAVHTTVETGAQA